MTTFLLCLSTIGFISFLSQNEIVGRYKAPFVFCCLISVTLFFFALANFLYLGVVVSVAIGCLMLVWQGFRYFRIDFKKVINFSDFLIIIPFVIFYIAIARDFKFLLWDEFSFWASSSKIIFETNALFKSDSPIFLKSYPPIQQLFQYYFVKQTYWSEKNVLYAQTFWVLSALLCVVGSVVKRPLNVALTFIVSSSFLYFFNYSYSTIYSDPLLGACFAASLALAIDTQRRTASVITFFVTIAALILIKEIAILLALVAICVFFICYSWQFLEENKSLKDKFLIPLMVTALGLLSTVGVLKSWSWYVAKIQSTRDIVIPGLSALSDPVFTKRVSLTVAEFFSRILKPGFLSFSQQLTNVSPSILFLFIIFTVLSFGIVLTKPRVERTRLGITLLIIFAGAFGYLAALLFSYLVFFTEYEGTRLASFERYFSSYVLAWLLILFVMLCSAMDELKQRSLVIAQAVIASVVFIMIPQIYIKELRSIESGGEPYLLRQKTEDFAAKVKKYIQPGEKVYFVAQNSNGLERTMFYYAMLPYTSSMSWCWSLGKKYYEGDVWSCDVNLMSLLDGYSYLAVYRGDDQLWQSANELFDSNEIKSASPSLFKINRSEGKIESIRRLD